jgi:hypothetical protein
MPHHLILQTHHHLWSWLVGDPHTGAFTRCWGLLWSPETNGLHPDWQDATFANKTHELLPVPQGAGFMFMFPGATAGDAPH